MEIIKSKRFLFFLYIMDFSKRRRRRRTIDRMIREDKIGECRDERSIPVGKKKKNDILTRCVKGWTTGVRIGYRVTSVCAVTVRRAGRASAITTACHNPARTRAAALPVRIGATTDAPSDATTTAASASTTGSCRHGTTV